MQILPLQAEVAELVQQIKCYRQVNGLTQEALAEQLGVTSTTIHRWEAGMSLPQGMNLQRLKEMFHLSEARHTISAVPRPLSSLTFHIQVHVSLTESSHIEVRVQGHLAPDSITQIVASHAAREGQVRLMPLDIVWKED
jgi:DNA-binding XRE family transcriptional regulator